jgi:hypothetical protein
MPNPVGSQYHQNPNPPSTPSAPNGYPSQQLPSMRTPPRPYGYASSPASYASANSLLAQVPPTAPPSSYAYAETNRFYPDPRSRPDSYYAAQQFPPSSATGAHPMQAAVPLQMQAAANLPMLPASLVNQTPDRTHVVGQQGRRGVLPSAPGRPPPAAASKFVPIKDDGGKWPCPNCTKSYLHAKHLKRHMLRHTGDRPYKCSLCSDTFSRSDILKRHWEKCSKRRGAPPGTDHLGTARGRTRTDRGAKSGRSRGDAGGASPDSVSSPSTPASTSATAGSVDRSGPLQLPQDLVPINSGLAATQLYDQSIWAHSPSYTQAPSTCTPTGTLSARTSRSNSLMHHGGVVTQNGASFSGADHLNSVPRTTIEEPHDYVARTALPNGLPGTYSSGVYASGYAQLTPGAMASSGFGYVPPASTASESNGMYARYGTAVSSNATNPNWEGYPPI